MSLACEGDSVPLQDRARLNGQGHCRWICEIQGEGGSHNDGLTTSNTGSNLEDSRMQMASMHYLTIAITLQADARC